MPRSITERVYALVFNGITAASAESDGFDSWLPLSERERFTRAVLAELRRGNIEFRLGPLALLADAAAAEARNAAQPAADHHARLAACDHPQGTGTICDVCGGDVAALMPAAADDFHDAVCTGPGVPAGFTCSHPSHARLAAGTEQR